VNSVDRLFRGQGSWRFKIVTVLLWVLLWPIVIAWTIVAAVRSYLRLDKSAAARTDRRINRFLSWYPAQWRARYGEELEQLLRYTIASGHGGARLTLNMLRESAAAHTTAAGDLAGSVCWALCWLPLIPQGVVPLVLKVTHTPVHSWFLAAYLPSPLQWPTIAVMIAVGLTMLVTAIRRVPLRRPAVSPGATNR
jgi:hypothetical protein